MSAPLVYLPRVDSTNTWARDHMNELAPFGAVYTTCQTAGRGRLGRAWQGVEDGGQLCVTVAFAPPLADPSGLPLLTGLVLAARLEALYGVACQVKWPNDILIDGKKTQRNPLRGGARRLAVRHRGQPVPAPELF